MGHKTNAQRARREPPAACNVCYREPRQPSSGHCRSCAVKYRTETFQKNRVNRRIAEARAVK